MLKRKFDRRQFLKGASLAAGAAVLAACSPAATATLAPTQPPAPAATDTQAAASSAATATQAPASTDTAAPVPTALPPVELSWALDAAGEPKDLAVVEAALNALPQLKAINVTIKLVFYDWGSFDQKSQLMFAGGTAPDLIFTSSWANNYINGAVSGNYVALDDLLPKYAPKTWAMVSPVAWTMSKVNGKIYAVPNQQIWYNAWGWQVRKDVADKYGITPDTVNKYEDLTPFMAKILADHPEWKYQLVQGSGPFTVGTMGYDGVTGGYAGAVIQQGDTTRTIINVNATQVMADRISLWRSWEQAGYAPQEVIDYATADAARKNGFYPVKLHVEKPGVSAEDNATYGVGDWVYKPLEKPVLGYILPTLTGFPASSKNTERALMFFDLVYSDPVVMNTIANGAQGTDWVWVDQSKNVIGLPSGVDLKSSGWSINIDWEIGNAFIAYYKNPEEVGAWDETAKVNATAVLPMPGSFVFDPKDVQSELAALQTVDTQYSQPLQFGLIDPKDPAKGIDAWIKAEKDAGLDKVIAAMQTQLNAFVTANPDVFKS